MGRGVRDRPRSAGFVVECKDGRQLSYQRHGPVTVLMPAEAISVRSSPSCLCHFILRRNVLCLFRRRNWTRSFRDRLGVQGRRYLDHQMSRKLLATSFLQGTVMRSEGASRTSGTPITWKGPESLRWIDCSPHGTLRNPRYPQDKSMSAGQSLRASRLPFPARTGGCPAPPDTESYA
jgi:hypothetical protein